MALKIDATGERATAPSPWSGGAITMVAWIRRSSTANQHQLGLINATNGVTGVPRVVLGTSTSTTMTSTYAGDSGTTNNGSTATYPSSTWFHAAAIFKSSAANTLNQTATAINGTIDTFSTAAARDLAATSVIDQFIVGTTAANSNSDFAHIAFFNGELTGDQITELQTKLPTAITGATPICYWSCIGDALNTGSGGSTYDLTLTGATIDSTNDGTLPALSGGGTPVSQDLVATYGVAASVSRDLAATYGVISTVSKDLAADYDIESATSVNSDLVATYSVISTVQSDLTSAYSTLSAVSQDIVATYSILDGAGNIRLVFGIKRERGVEYASETGVRWWVYSPDGSEYARGTGLSFNSEGQAIIDLDATPFSIGDRVHASFMKETADSDPIDRTIRSGHMYAIAVAQP